MRKPTKCLGENKSADQIRSNREADQGLCFRYMDNTFFLIQFYVPFKIISAHMRKANQ